MQYLINSYIVIQIAPRQPKKVYYLACLKILQSKKKRAELTEQIQANRFKKNEDGWY